MSNRVSQEVAIHSRLKHPAILEVYTFFENSNYVYMILELCHNGELQRYLKMQESHVLSEQEGKRPFFPSSFFIRFKKSFVLGRSHLQLIYDLVLL